MSEIDAELVASVLPVVARHTRRTPLLESEWLSEVTGGRVLLKCENLQVTGSFKVRGAVAALAQSPPAAVVACSAGNHGLGVARAAAAFGIPCTVVVPSTVPRVKEEAILRHGARVLRSPHAGYDDTQAWTLARLEELRGAFLSPFDDPLVIAGNGGTTGAEIFDEAGDLDAVVVPCGGGGCAVGIGVVARSRRPRAKVIAVNTDASPGMWLSRRDGRAHLRVEGAETVCEGLEGGVSERTYRLGLETIDDVVLAREETIRRAVGEVARREHLVVEGSAAAGVAALLDGALDAAGKRICVVLTGGNIDSGRLAELLR